MKQVSDAITSTVGWLYQMWMFRAGLHRGQIFTTAFCKSDKCFHRQQKPAIQELVIDKLDIDVATQHSIKARAKSDFNE